jgi:hypothetical protein
MYVIARSIRRMILDYHHHIPLLKWLPSGFSSNGAILFASDITEVLLNEHSIQSESEDISMSSFPLGCEKYIASQLDEVLGYLLYESVSTFDNYTSRLIRSVYFPNIILGYYESHFLREQVLVDRGKSLIRCRKSCMDAIARVIQTLQHSIDITESMKLPMRVTSKLYSRMSILLSIPMGMNDPLSEYLLTSPQIIALEAWCERVNAGCKLWPSGSINWRRKHRGQHTSPTNITRNESVKWWEFFGWSAQSETGDPGASAPSTFTPNKAHNIWFGLVSVSAIFVYIGMSSSR